MEKIEVITFYVGFGDCIHITFPDNKQMLVDTGYAKHFKNICSVLKEKNKRIDYLMLTHAHADHINATIKFLDKFTIKSIIWWLNEQNSSSPTNAIVFPQIINHIKTRKFPVYSIEDAKKGIDTFNRYIDVLYPFDNNTTFVRNQNKNSIVFTVKIGEKKLLFMGDSTSDIEEEILEYHKIKLNDVIFIKLGHHGSDTSTSEKLMKSLDTGVLKALACSNKESWQAKPPSNEKLANVKKNGLERLEHTGGINGEKRHLIFHAELNQGEVSCNWVTEDA